MWGKKTLIFNALPQHIWWHVPQFRSTAPKVCPQNTVSNPGGSIHGVQHDWWKSDRDAAFMTWKSLLFWCSSSSLFQLYNCKFSVYRKKKSVWFLDYSQRFNSHQLNLKLGLVWHKLIIVLFASLNFMKIKYVWGSSRTSRKSSNISRSATGQVLLHKDTFQPFRR